jgi:predicted nucleic acid-binding protein
VTVVSNTSPLSYLVSIGHENVLATRFRGVPIPEAARQELCHPRAPAIVRAWAQKPPAWEVVFLKREYERELSAISPDRYRVMSSS